MHFSANSIVCSVSVTNDETKVNNTTCRQILKYMFLCIFLKTQFCQKSFQCGSMYILSYLRQLEGGYLIGKTQVNSIVQIFEQLYFKHL